MHLNADVPVSAMVLKPTFFRKGLCEHHPCRKVSLMSSHVVSESFLHMLYGQDIFRCCLALDKDKPSSSAIRSARRVVFGAAKSEGPFSDCAKSLLTYPAGKAAMEVSRQYSADGLEDEAGDMSFNALVGSFEEGFAVCFDDLQSWCLRGPGDRIQTMASVSEKLDSF